ncbi:amino acid adenylation domain-containing protein [Streptomyces sp. NPDC005892]|uniref:amino acid adenylation domain-containing protein n=1 Tax=Streptomyces sp. NPDC005892 TaxID=3155593 RepID=UPI0033F77B0E
MTSTGDGTRTLDGAWHRHALRFPGRPALVDAAGRSLTYAELSARAGSVAERLSALGVRPGSRVAVIGGRTAQTVTALLGVMRAGAAYCVVDPALPAARQDMLLADLRPAAVVRAAPDATGDEDASFGVESREGNLGTGSVSPALDGDPPAYVMYTSGSTGRPKGVVVGHASVLAMLDSYDELAPPRTRLAGTLLAPPLFDVSVWEIFSVLTRGGTLHVPGPQALTDGAALWDCFSARGITSAYVAPGLLAPLVAAARTATADVDLDRVLVGVEPIPQGTLAELTALCPGLRAVNGYGPTEATITATLHLFRGSTDPARRVPIGRAVRGAQVRLLDESLEPVPDGATGEIVIIGACLAQGYLNAGDDTGERFADSPWGRAYRTGDLGRRLPDGTLEFCGRLDHQVKISGFRVEPGEVEAVLNTLPGVRRGVVLAVGGEGQRRLTAAVEGDARTAADVRNFLADRLPAHMVPSRVLVVPALPLTANGKIDIAALTAADRARPLDGPSATEPSTQVERTVAAVWADVLGLDRIGVEDDFHWLGGTSLDAVRIAGALRTEGFATAAAHILRTRTVRALVAAGPQGATTGSTPRAAEPGTHPATRGQEGLWAWRELHPGSAGTTVVHAVRMDGAVDAEHVRSAWEAVVHRHETLRTVFTVGTDGRPRQQVTAPGTVSLAVRPVAEERAVEERMTELLRRRFDVTASAWSAELLLMPGGAVFLLAADHLVLDGESTAVLESELLRAYGDRGSGSTEPVPGPVAAARAPGPDQERRDALTAYWRTALTGLEDHRPLPEPMRADLGPARTQRTGRDVPETVWQEVREVARAGRTTPFVVMLAALKAFLGLRGAAGDRTVTIAVSRREALGLPRSLGHFVNLLPVRDPSPIGPGTRFDRYLAVVRDTAAAALEHGGLPFEDMLDLLPAGSGARTAATRVVLAQRARGTTGPYGVRRSSSVSNALYDLTVFLDEGYDGTPTRLQWVCDASTTLEGGLDRCADAFAAFLEHAAAAPATPLSSLPSLSAAEERTVAAALRHAPAAPLSLVDLFEAQLRDRPEATAVIDGVTRVSYAELGARADLIGARLPVETIRGRTPVAVVLDKGTDLLAALLAVVRAGCPYLPLAPEHAPTRLADLVRRAGVRVCVTRSGLLGAMAPTDLPPGTGTLLLDDAAPGVPAPDRTKSPGPVAAESRTVPGPEDLAYLMPTSGSTGAPKLVGIPHRAVVRLVHRSRTLPLTHRDRTLLVANTSFDAATLEIWGALANGGSVVVPSPAELRDPALLCAALERHGVTTGFFTTTLFARMLEAAPERLGRMRHLLVGGEAVPPSLIDRALPHVGEEALLNGYGPTENTTFSCCHRVTGPVGHLRSLPVGGPVTGSGVAVVDGALGPVPVGMPGEIVVTGTGLASGYMDDPKTTADRFVRLPVDGAPRAYRTGDRGRLLFDGTVEYLGRIDRQLKIRGFRVEPTEVEAALEAHPGVRRAAAYPQEDMGVRRLMSAVERTSAGADDTGPALRAWLASRVPPYLLPDRVLVVDSFPMTSNGKLDVIALIAAGRAAGDDPARAVPADELHRTMSDLWSQALGLSHVGMDDDFFELGGNSMTALALAARLSEATGRRVPPHLVWSARTIRTLTAEIRDRAAPEPRQAEAAERRVRLQQRAARIRGRSGDRS